MKTIQDANVEGQQQGGLNHLGFKRTSVLFMVFMSRHFAGRSIFPIGS